MLGSLDFLYAPSADVATDAKGFVDAVGAELVFAIERSGTRVAMLRLGTGAPAILLTDHLPDERPILLYRVDSVADADAHLKGRGWNADRTLELPMGTCATFTAPG